MRPPFSQVFIGCYPAPSRATSSLRRGFPLLTCFFCPCWFLAWMRWPCICAGGPRTHSLVCLDTKPLLHHHTTTPQLGAHHVISFFLDLSIHASCRSSKSYAMTNTSQLALPHLLQRPVGRVPPLDPVRSVSSNGRGHESGRDGGSGELSEKGRLNVGPMCLGMNRVGL